MYALRNERVDTAVKAAFMTTVGVVIGYSVGALHSEVAGYALALPAGWLSAGLAWRVTRVWSPFLVALAAVLSYGTARFAFAESFLATHLLLSMPLTILVGSIDRPVDPSEPKPPTDWRATIRRAFETALLLAVITVLAVLIVKMFAVSMPAAPPANEIGCSF